MTNERMLREALEKIVAGGFNCSPHQYYMAAQGVAERALASPAIGDDGKLTRLPDELVEPYKPDPALIASETQRLKDEIAKIERRSASPTDDVLRVTVNGLWERRHTLTPKDWQDAAPLLLGWLVAALSSAVPTKTDTPSSGEAA